MFLRIAMLILLLMSCLSLQARTLRYQGGGNPYFVDVLRLVSSHMDEQTTLVPVFELPSQERSIRLLEHPIGIDVFWGVATKEREELALAIPVPIDKGLMGYRVPIVRTENRDLLAKVNSADDLDKIIFGLGTDWPDSHVFRANGLAVTTFAKNELQFKMLLSERFDVFPDNILDYAQDSLPAGLVFDQRLAFHYPSAMYFFVAKKDPQLHKVLSEALNRVVENGEFDALFSRYFNDVLEKVDLDSRQIIELTNPLFTPEPTLEGGARWFSVEEQ